MINCSSCGAANRSNSRFCQACGVELDLLQPVICPHCGTPNPAASAFCIACEARLPREPDPDPIDQVSAKADEKAPAKADQPAGERSLPVWMRGLEQALPDKDPREAPDSEMTAEAIPDVLPDADPMRPPSPADETPLPPDLPQEDPPDWLMELSPTDLSSTSFEEEPPGTSPPGWLEPATAGRRQAGLELANADISPQTAIFPEWLRECPPGSEEPEQVPPPVAEPRVEAGPDDGLQPIQAGEVDDTAPVEDPIPVQSEDAAFESNQDERPVRAASSVFMAGLSARQGELLHDVKDALVTEAAVSRPSAPDPPGASHSPVAAAATRARLFSEVVSSSVPIADGAPAEGSSALVSLLALDCGSATTRAFLFDQVDGSHRFLACGEAPSTAGPPTFDPLLSVRRALSALAETTGGDYLDDGGQVISPRHQGRGVDALVTVQSDAPSLRLILIGVKEASGLDQARRAAAATSAQIVGTVALESGRRTAPGGDDVQEQVRLVRGAAPDAIISVSTGDGDSDALVVDAIRAVALACSSQPADRRPAIFFVGDPELRSDVAEAVGTDAELRFVELEPDSPGDRTADRLVAEIEEFGRQHWVQRRQGLATLAEWSAAPILPAWKAFGLTLQYLARRSAETVLGLDIGAARATVAAATDGDLHLLVRSDLGLAHNAANILDLVNTDLLLRWLPYEIDAVDVANELYNKALRPGTLPQSRHDLLLEQAVGREIIRLVVADIAQRWPGPPEAEYLRSLSAFDVIVASGGVLASAPSYGQAVLMLVDALQPVGLSRLYLDRDRLATVAGALAMVNPLAASQVLERDGLLCLGTVVAPAGLESEAAGDKASLTVKVESEGGRVRVVRVAHGALRVISLPAGQTATVDVLSASGSHIPLDVDGQAGPAEVLGGAVGIIVDARGRPLPVAEEPVEQRRRLQGWLRAVGA